MTFCVYSAEHLANTLKKKAKSLRIKLYRRTSLAHGDKLSVHSPLVVHNGSLSDTSSKDSLPKKSVSLCVRWSDVMKTSTCTAVGLYLLQVARVCLM